MMKTAFAILLIGSALISHAQVVTTSPAIPRPDQPVTITVNVAGTSLSGYAWNNTTAPVWIWTWIAEGCTSGCDAPTNVNPATAAQDAAKATRISTNPDIYQITFTPTTFFNKPASQLKKIGLKLKTRDWNDNKQTDNDRFFTLSEDFAITFTQPSQSSFFVDQNQQVPITVSANEPASIAIKQGNTVLAQSEGDVTTFSYTHTVTELSGSQTLTAEATNGTDTKTLDFTYVVRQSTSEQTRPVGIKDGINYGADPTKVTLGLWAPGKSSVYVIGDFTDWDIDTDYQMKKDGEHFWLEISGLVPGQEYGFQYLVDETLRLADPYADKILDPDDQYIPASIYPDLKPYPAKARYDQWYFNRVSVLQTNQTPYAWQVPNFEKPAKDKLVIYELLVRDYFSANERNYQNLIDTLAYIKRMGVNAIELMPVTEFNGNDSWGYNPTFMFAPDKAYGTKNKLKEFIDVCHQQGIAVILDIVMNHQDAPNTYVLMDFNFTTFKPNPTNKWFNVEATHPFSVFFDMNHESSYTKAYLDTINHYWLHEYKIDGFRYDLSKGFTQVNNPTNVDAWSAYDASRIAILKRMSDKIWSHTPDAYVILEHLSANDEEKELAEYRKEEGLGMMPWGKMTDPYNQNTLGFSANSSIAGVYHATRGWSVPRLVGYMESHDEERIMYKNLQFGNSNSAYTVKNLRNATDRVKSAAALFFTVPGPKMFWQFGELGYDVSIEFGGRVSAKPLKWEYQQSVERARLYKTFSELIRLRNTYDVFATSDVTFQESTALIKQLILKNQPYTAAPASADEMNVFIIANFDIAEKQVAAFFPHTGTWYNYFQDSESAVIAATPASILLRPGEFRLYTDVQLTAPESELQYFLKPQAPVITSVSEANGRLYVAWDDNSTIEKGYRIYRRKTGGVYSVIGEAAENAGTFEDKYSLEPQVTYEYYVEAYTLAGSVSQSGTESITASALITGVEDEIKNSLQLYPNPATRELTIASDAFPVQHVRFLTAQGLPAMVQKKDTQTYDLSQLASGIYIVELQVANHNYRFKIVKQ